MSKVSTKARKGSPFRYAQIMVNGERLNFSTGYSEINKADEFATLVRDTAKSDGIDSAESLIKQRQIEAGRIVSPLTIERLIELYQDYNACTLRPVKAETLWGNIGQLKKFQSLMGVKMVSEITRPCLRAWQEKRTKDGIKAQSIKTSIRSMQSLLKRDMLYHLKDNGYEIENPFDSIPAPKKVITQRYKPLCDESRKMILPILDKLPARQRLIGYLCYVCGFRRSEVDRLKVVNVHVPDPTSGRSSLQIGDGEQDSKTGVWRYVEIPDSVDFLAMRKAIIAEDTQRQKTDANKVLIAREDCPYLLPNSKVSRDHVEGANSYRMADHYSDLIKALRVIPEFKSERKVLHRLRKESGSIMLAQQGGNIFRVAAMLGHSIVVAQAIYYGEIGGVKRTLDGF